jgi:hypothetical protein
MIDTANRRKLINEVLNYDKEIDQRVLNLEKQQIKKWGAEDPQPFIQVDDDVVTAAKETVANLKVLLDQKLAGFNDHELKSATVEDVIKLYNNLAELFIKSSNTNATKIAVRNVANSLESLIETILISLGDWGRISTPTKPLRKAYKLYDTIRDQLNSGNIKPITADDFIARIESRPPSASDSVARSITEFHRTDESDDEDDDDDADEGRPRESDVQPTSLPAEVVEPAEVEEPPEPELSSSTAPAEPKSKVLAKMYAKEFLPPTSKNIAKMITQSTSPKLLSSSLTEEQLAIISKAITPVSKVLAKTQQLEHYTPEQLESTVARMSRILNETLSALAGSVTLTFIRDRNINLIGIAAKCAGAIGNRINKTFESMVEEPTSSSSSSSIVTVPNYRIDKKSVITAATRAFAQAACEKACIDVMKGMTETQLAESVFDAGLQAAYKKADDIALSLNYNRKYTQNIINSELQTMSQYAIDATTLALVQYMSRVTKSQHEPEIDITYNPVQRQAKSASSGSQSKAKSALVPIIKPKLTSKHPHSTPFPKSSSIKWIPAKGAPKWIKAIPSSPPPKAEAGSGRRAKKLVAGTGGTINDSDIEKKPKTITKKKKVVTSIPVHTPDLHYNPDLNDVYFVR